MSDSNSPTSLDSLPWSEPRVCVVGDVMVDAYMWGHVHRISPEAPVPVVEVSRKEQRVGGAANVVKNLAALGAEVDLISVVPRSLSASTMGDRIRAKSSTSIREASSLTALWCCTLLRRPP